MPAKKSDVNLKTVANRVGLAPCSVSAVLNRTPASYAIPQSTKDRIFQAAAELNYRPNFWARSLRTKRTSMVAVVARELGNPAVAGVVAAAQEHLSRKGYLLVLGSITQSDELLSASFQQRGIEGVITIDATLPGDIGLPVVTINLGYLTPGELIGDELKCWLKEFGAAAAEAVIREIEDAKPSRSVPVSAQAFPASLECASQSFAASRETA